MSKCINYEITIRDLIIPSKVNLVKICNLKDKRNLFIVSVIRFIIFIYINILFKIFYKRYNKNIIFKSLLLLLYSIIVTLTIINMVLIYYVYQKDINQN